ncbi:J domain-containing protein [Qaidamihabitans albus]|uniref:J domain-containing protein n=1 Tax=Qaidamihabitans albus TaxID=2795733 RepID=UPI0018F21F21|nr:DnaJ domain-containing protein [Qaidamihabitans albus]
MDDVDYYELLGVRPDATHAQIKSAYRTLARSMHPDTGGTAGTFRLLREAYETLNDPARRAEYDRDGDSDSDDDATGRDDEANGAARDPAATTATRARRRAPGRAHRGRRFGEDPGFAPPPVRIDVDTIPWWGLVDARERVHYAHPGAPGHAPWAAAAGGLALLAAPPLLPVEFSTPLLVCWLVLVVAALVAGRRLMRHHRSSVRTARAFRDEFGGRTVFGRPGADRDQAGERLTADLLSRYLTRLPGVRIFHGLAWPDSVFADIDHAVLCGRRLVLIESKLWLPGHYTTDAAGTLLRNGQRFRGGGSRLADGVDAFRALLPEVEVRGALVLYPSRSGALSTGAATGAAAPMAPERFVREIGDWLAVEPYTVDRSVFRVVLGQVAGTTRGVRDPGGRGSG